MRFELAEELATEVQRFLAIRLLAGPVVALPGTLACGQVTWQVPPAPVEPWLPPLTTVAAAVRSITHPPGTP